MYKLIIENNKRIYVSVNDSVCIYKVYTVDSKKILIHEYASLISPQERKLLQFSFKNKYEAVNKAQRLIRLRINIQNYK